MMTKLLVTTGSFVAGAIVDDNGRVVTTDHWLAHLRNLTEEQFREACAKNKWAVAVAPN
jgi:sugar lactone lactonase YvrE